MACYVICCYVNYQFSKIRPRVEEGRRRIARPISVGGPPAPWLRSPQVDRGALGRRAEVQRRLALSPAIPTGKSRLDRRPLGGESRAAAATLLQIDERRQEGAGRATKHLGVVCGRHQSRNETGKCLTGSMRSDGGWQIYSWSRRARPQSSRKSRGISMIATRSRLRAALRRWKPIV